MSGLVLSVVIPAFNRRALLDLALRALLRTEADGGAYEVIVVDDGSTDGTGDYVQAAFPGVVYLWRSKNVGKPNNPGLARNCGIRVARGRWVAFMDSDIVHCHDIIGATIEQAVMPGVWKGYGHWIMERDYKCATEVVFESGAEERMPGQFWTVVDCETVTELGGFDERFTDYGAEDEDLVARLCRCGHVVRHVTGQFAVGLYASRGIPGGVLERRQNDWQREIAQTDRSVVRNVGVDWGRPHEEER